MKFRYAVLAVLLVLPTMGCDEAPPAAPNQVIVTQTVTVGGQTSPTASPSPGASNCVREAIDSVRVNPFGYVCPAGVTRPSNSSGVLPLGCTAIVTATPKDRNNVDVPASLHGPQITWSVPIGGERIVADEVPEQAFNRNVSTRPNAAPGDFRLEALVCGVVGAWNGRVVP